MMEFWWGQWPSLSRFEQLSFYESPSDFSIKSYDRLKFCHANFLKLQIYHFSLHSENSSIKYTLNQVPTEKFGSNINFYLFLMNFTILLVFLNHANQTPCFAFSDDTLPCFSRPILCLLHYY